MARTAKGKSLGFIILILAGYIFGITSKILTGTFKWYVIFFYVLNFSVVSADLFVYFRNYKLDKKQEIM